MKKEMDRAFLFEETQQTILSCSKTAPIKSKIRCREK